MKKNTNVVFVLILFVCMTMRVSGIVHRNNSDDKWHPDFLYVVYPNMKFVFRLPCEKEQSGVANLLFKSNKDGHVYLLDEVNDHKRYYKQLWGKYDAVLLFNNGNYVVYNDIVFDEGVDMEIDMKSLHIQPCDSASQHWLTFRTFLTNIGEAERKVYKRVVSEKKIRGYVMVEDGAATDFPLVKTIGESAKRASGCTLDGYFELDDLGEETIELEFFCIGHRFEYLNVNKNSGVFYVLDSPRTEELKGITTAPVGKH